jgi:hypothetical protein
LHAFIVKVDGLIAYPATVADEVVLACFGAVRVVHGSLLVPRRFPVNSLFQLFSLL